MSEFAGVGAPLSADGLAAACDQLRVGLPEIWAVLTVETSGCGFLRDRRPQILFERHVFHRETGGSFDAADPGISSRSPGGYGSSGDHQYDRLGRAIRLDRAAALRSASWGIGQVMGNNAVAVGFADVEMMVSAMVASEDAQLNAMFAYCKQAGIDRALREHDWADFARGYNGRGYAKHAYHTKLQKWFSQYKANGAPNVDVRVAQVYLRYRGFDPGPVDGVSGKQTSAAIKRFQQSAGIPQTGAPDAATLAALEV